MFQGESKSFFNVDVRSLLIMFIAIDNWTVVGIKHASTRTQLTFILGEVKRVKIKILNPVLELSNLNIKLNELRDQACHLDLNVIALTETWKYQDISNSDFNITNYITMLKTI